jgi:hypothetical protein
MVIVTFKSKNSQVRKLIVSFIHHDMTSAPNPTCIPSHSQAPIYLLSIGDQHEKQFHPQQGGHSTYTKYEYFHFLGLCEMSLPIRLEIFGNHHSWLNNSCLLGEICPRKGLTTISIDDSYIWIDVQRHQSYHQFSCQQACQSTPGSWSCHHLS